MIAHTVLCVPGLNLIWLDMAKSFIEMFLVRLFHGPSTHYQPLSNKPDIPLTIVSLKLLSVVTLGLPLFGFAFCILWSLAYDFTEATSTHCGVSNYLPSVSASIGSFSPQKYFWRSTIALHTSPRYLVSYIYYVSIHNSRILLIINFIEISALLGLSMVSSTEMFPFHAFCFMMFIVATFFGMLKHLFHDKLWSKFKLKLFNFNTLSWILALFFYFRHNTNCETGIYTLFALSEYVFVLSNMAFHFQAYYDFKDNYLCFGKINYNLKQFPV